MDPAATASDKLLVVLHGRGDSAAGFRWLPEAFRLDSLNYLLVNAPDPYYGGRSWYDLPPDQAPGVMRSRGLLDALFDELLASGFTAENIGLFGFSQGSLMTLEWGARSPLGLAAYVCVSGYCLDPRALLEERNPGCDTARWLVTHGTHDEALDYEQSALQLDILRQGGFELRFETYDKMHTIDPDEELPVLRDFVAERFGFSITAR